MRRLITAFFRVCLRIFFRRIEVMGLTRVPDEGAVMFAVNHPNGLVDPLFILCFAPRPVSFLAKAPLFEYPFIGWFARVFEAIPVYRKQDRTTGSNEETFAKARDLLRRGGSLAIFPEGTTHDDPRLRELKSGAARIALGACVEGLRIVPAGIYYTAKHRFRSAALVVFGDPVEVSAGDGETCREPQREEVETLTGEIDRALDAVTLQADSHAALALIARAEDIFTANDRQPLTEEFDLRRRFIDGYHFLKERDPERLARLESDIARLDVELRRARIDVHELTPEVGIRRLFRVVVLLPLAILGGVLNYLPYRAVGIAALRFARGEEHMVATMKFLAALAFYPLFWIAAATLAWLLGSLVWGLATFTFLPLLGYAALRGVEEADDVIGDVRAVVHRLLRRRGHDQLLSQWEAIRKEMRAVAREMR